MLIGFAIFVPLAVFHDMLALWARTKSYFRHGSKATHLE